MNVTDVTPPFSEERVSLVDLHEVPSENVFTIRKRDKKTEKRKARNETESKKGVGKKEKPVSWSNSRISVDECRQSLTKQGTVKCPRPISVDIQLPAGCTNRHIHMTREQGGCQLPERSEGCERSKENVDVQESPIHLNIHLTIRRDAAADASENDDDDDVDIDEATVTSETRTGSAVPWTVNHVGSGHITLGPTVSFTHTEPRLDSKNTNKNASTKAECLRRHTSKMDLRDGNRSAVPTGGHTGDPKPRQKTYNNVTNPLDKELPRTGRIHQTSSPSSESLSDIRRALRELDVMLDRYNGANVKPETCEKKTRESAVEDEIGQPTIPDNENALDSSSELVKIDHAESELNRVNCDSEDPELTENQGTPSTMRKPSNIEHRQPQSSIRTYGTHFFCFRYVYVRILTYAILAYVNFVHETYKAVIFVVGLGLLLSHCVIAAL